MLRSYYRDHRLMEAPHLFLKMSYNPGDFLERPPQCPCCKEAIAEGDLIWQCNRRLLTPSGPAASLRCKTIKCEKNCVKSFKQAERRELLQVWAENVRRDRGRFLNEEPLPIVTCATELMAVLGKNRWCLPWKLDIPAVQRCNHLEWKSKRDRNARDDFAKSFGTVVPAYSAEGTPFSLSSSAMLSTLDSDD